MPASRTFIRARPLEAEGVESLEDLENLYLTPLDAVTIMRSGGVSEIQLQAALDTRKRTRGVSSNNPVDVYKCAPGRSSNWAMRVMQTIQGCKDQTWEHAAD